MIIECSSCNSRFRLDDSKITGRGARVRCRKCGEAINVMKEDVDAQAGPGAAEPGTQEEGFDLRSILRETMDAPVESAPMPTDGEEPQPPAADSGGAEALQADFEKMMADAGAGAAAPTVATPAAESQMLRPAESAGAAEVADGGSGPTQEAPARTAFGVPLLDFGPEEKLTFAQPLRKDPPPAEARPPQARETPPPPAAPASSSEFMMSTSDSLDFLKADYKQQEQKADLDISGSLRVAPAPGPDQPRVAPPPGTQAAHAGGAGAAAPAPPPSRSEAIRSELAGLGGAGAAAGQGWPSAATSADGRVPRAQEAQERPGAGGAGAAAAGKAPAAAPSRARIAAPPPAPFPPPRAAAAPKPSGAVRRAPGKRSAPLKRGQGSQLARPSVVLLLLLFFALAGGGAFLGFTSDGQKIMRGLVPRIESLWLGDGKPVSRYVVGNDVGYYETNAKAGKMFVIKGQVTNEGQLRKTGVRVYAAILDVKSTKMAEKTVYAGNVFAGDALRQAPRAKIEAAMSNPIGGGLANMDIPPGKAVPFMVVFFDAPEGIDSYRLEPRDVD